ncbi:hypothetical protein PYCCODRAFT_1362247 [Trametes coccinea BRFM310]|uniref:G-patch domain-containing protein n=1 Tax=Trametes coccinea (strain BRFM310) TaxID=1353009 RepID=A0A1Y2IXM5_TRAC3|nr:hypothetical protein PYCCODRAFT_1362247 [Trametes coccinea BRFM310]
MTSRLKRKLNDLGVDTASSKANESFCLIGTPLPPLEKSKDTGEFVPLWKQEVRDEKGRRRLHGAFTGGFSAGYFNTVGSKEGWTPSTFVSSRAERAKKKVARPEDFMDEEDLAEIRENRKLVDEHEEMEFGTAAEKRKQMEADDQDPITAALAASLAPPPKDSVGAQILKKMGWRPGQGIGPRLTYAQRKRQDAGFLDPSKEVEGDEDDVEEAKKHMYPRRDIPVITAPRKDNFHGLGYTPGLGLNESVGYGGSTQRQSSGPQIAAGFGLGALNDADEDDIDIYDSGPGAGRSRVAFDETLGDDDQHISIGSSRGKRSERETRVPPGITQTFRDGTTVLKGFILSNKPIAEDRWFPGPEVPPDWKPNPRRVWEQSKNKENVPVGQDKPQTGSQQPLSHAAWKSSQLSADQRGSILGETPLPAKTRSVFDYMSQKDRERLESIRNTKAGAPAASAEARAPSPGPPPPAPGGLQIPHLHPSVAKAALQGFQPFASDPVKHSRYTAFLTFQANHVSGEPVDNVGFGPLPGQSMEEFNKELADYAKSATVFKPLSGAMAGRFRSAVVVETGPKIFEGLHQPDTSAEGEDSQADHAEEKEEDPKMGAVRLGMYGPLTREVQPWQPAKLLCKRFGVREPEVDMTGPAGAASSDFEFATGAAKGVSQALETPSGDVAGAAPALITASSDSDTIPRNGGRRDLANIGLGEDETQGQDILTYQRPDMDVFKAIFASDDEVSDDEVDEARKEEETTPAPLDFFGTARPEPKAEPTPPPPAPPAFTNAPLEKVDLATFKPTFVPRSDRESRKDKSEKKDKKSKDKKVKTSLMSFDVEDDGSIPSFGPSVSKEKDKERKKKRRKERHDDEDDAMWVEKPPPEVVKDLPIPPPLPPDSGEGKLASETNGNALKASEAGPPRGRKRAVDFM